MASSNMYRVRDYVYFETSATAPYQIRRIEELNKTPTGAVEAKVTGFYRRRDLAPNLIQLADRHHQYIAEDEQEEREEKEKLANKTKTTQETPMDTSNGDADPKSDVKKAITNGSKESKPSAAEMHSMELREVFLCKDQESLPATQIRGKCRVVVECEEAMEARRATCRSPDTFFYYLVLDSEAKTLLADRGEIQIGPGNQADIPPLLKSPSEDPRNDSSSPQFHENLSSLSWSPSLCESRGMSPAQVDEFLVMSKAVGMLARAVESSVTARDTSVVAAAGAASRDITHQRALDLINKSDYDMEKALGELTVGCKPLYCCDELESWTPSECSLFEEGLSKYGKCLADIRNDFLPWKTQKSLVEYYTSWKTTERYVGQRRTKATQAETRLKQVYIPNYVWPNTPALYDNNKTVAAAIASGAPLPSACECCQASSSPQWYAWGPPTLICKLCSSCWSYWKRYGGLKNPHTIARKKASLNNENGVTKETAPPVTTNGEEASGSYFCSQANCDREYRLSSQLARHLAQVHDIHSEQNGVPNASSRPKGGFVVCISPALRLARALSSKVLQAKRLARKPDRKSLITLDEMMKNASERLPHTKPSTRTDLINFKLSFPPLDSVVLSRIHSRRDPSASPHIPTPDFLRHDKPLSDSTLNGNKSATKPNLAFPRNDTLRRSYLIEPLSNQTAGQNPLAVTIPHRNTNSITNHVSPSRLHGARAPIMKKRDYSAHNGTQDGPLVSNGSHSEAPAAKRQMLIANGNNNSSSKSNTS